MKQYQDDVDNPDSIIDREKKLEEIREQAQLKKMKQTPLTITEKALMRRIPVEQLLGPSTKETK